MESLTEKQQKIFKFLTERLENNYVPSQREIADHFGLAQNAVHQLIGYLKNKGYLEDSGGHRGIRLSKAYLAQINQTQGIPIIGRVAAGSPILAQENIEGYINLDEDLFKRSKDMFILRIVGDSMIDEGIMNGDLVVVKPSSTIESGKIGVVLLDDDATVKRIFIQRNKIALKPANKSAGYKTIYVKRGDKNVRIIGKVISCLRTNIN